MITRDIESIKETLIGVLNEVNEGRFTVVSSQSAEPLRSLGVDSVGLLAFLVAIEDAFAIEWSEDAPREAFTSVDTLARYLDGNASA